MHIQIPTIFVKMPESGTRETGCLLEVDATLNRWIEWVSEHPDEPYYDV
jgi:hypothetical protein